MSEHKKKIFFTGATGYIGGSVFVALAHSKKYEITALCREKSRVQKLEEIGAKSVVVASLDDLSVLENAAENSDIVMHTADSDHPESCKAFLSGLKKRAQHSSVKPIYIHVSGTGCLCDKANGQFASDKIFDDANRADVHDSIPVTAWHRNVDLLIFEAGKTGLIDCHIICPPTIYGKGSGPFKTESHQIPGLIRTGISHKRAVHVGKGLNVWSNVHIDDLVDFFVLHLEKSISGQAPKNDDGFYFAENGSNNHVEITNEIGKALHKRGLSKESTAEGIPEEKVPTVFPGNIAPATAYNSRSRASKARQLGWNPHRPALLATIDETVERISHEKV